MKCVGVDRPDEDSTFDFAVGDNGLGSSDRNLPDSVAPEGAGASGTTLD